MKFFIKVLILISVSAVYSSHVFMKRSINNFLEDIGTTINNFSDECIKEITKRYECIPDLEDEEISKKSLDELCTIHTSDNCKNLFMTEMKNSKDCEKEKDRDMINFLSITFSMYNLEFDNYCLKDEDGKYCSIGQFEFEDIYSPVSEKEKQEKYNTAVNNQCKSKKCTDGFIKYGTEASKIIEEGTKLADMLNQNNKKREFESTISRDSFGEKESIKGMNETITYLKSGCTLQDSINESNDAFLVMYTSSICMGIGLLIYIFFIL